MMQSWFSRKMLVRLEPQVKLAEFAQRDELPLRTGTTATWNGWRTLGAASSTLAEGTVNSLAALSSRRVTATIAGYGRGHKLTDLFQMTAIFDAVNGAMDVLSDSAAKTVERICQTGIYKSTYANNLSTTGILSALMSSVASGMSLVTCPANNNSNSLFQFPAVFAAASSVARLSATSKTAPSISAQVSMNLLRKITTRLRGKNARPMADGMFVGYTHPNALHTLRRDPTWVNWNQYQNSKETMYRGETGMVEGIRFVTSTEAPRYAVAAHSVNMVFVFGQQAYGLTTLNGQVEMLISRGPDKSDPFNQFTDVAYKIYGAAACLNPSAGVIGFGHELLS